MLGTTNSLVNPVGGSAAFDHGTKSVDSFTTFSVGIKSIDSIGYMQKPSNGTKVTVTITNGILEFSHPQAHSYVGVGDSVYLEYAPVVYYLNEKISTTKWRVFEISGGIPIVPSGIVDQPVLKIDKTFEHLYEAISDIPTLITETDLTVLKTTIRIACYKMADSTDTNMVVDGWTTDEDHYVKIFAPSNLKTECNSRQKHVGIAGNCYQLTVAATISGGLDVKQSYTEINGLTIDGGNQIDNILIRPNLTGLKGVKIIDNILSNAGIGVSNTVDLSTGHIIKGNTIYNMGVAGISTTTLTDCYHIYNNTIHGNSITPDGILCAGSGSQIIRNNLVQGCTNQDITAISASDIIRCITSDNSSAGGTNCYPNTSIVFKDVSTDDYRLDPRAIDEAVRYGDSLEDDTTYAFDTDIVGNKIDDSWPIGSYHYVRELRVAIGNPNTDDLKTGTPNAVITNGIITFDTAQINDNICSGCVVTFADAAEFILHEKIDTSNWIVTRNNLGSQGYGYYSKVSTAVSSIKATFNNLYEAITNNSGDPGIVTLNGGSFTFVSTDLKVTVYCSYGTSDLEATTNGLTFDETRTLTILTPNDEDLNCNLSRRHSGIFDSNKWSLLSSTSIGINIACSNVEINGLQLSATNGDGIYVSGNGCDFVVKNNIVKDSNGKGISINSSVASKKSVIVNNLIYKCGSIGINIVHNTIQADSHYFIYNNTVDNCDIGIKVASNIEANFTNIIVGKNNLVQNSSVAGYRSNTYDPKYVSFDSCWCNDSSILKFVGKNNKATQVVVFKDLASGNYHIDFATSTHMSDAEALSADGDYSFDDDFEGDFRDNLKWDIGCDNFSISDEKIANFSLGMKAVDDNPNLNDTAGLKATIKNSIIIFSEQELSTSVGVGDCVSLASGNYYLAEKGNDYTWVVRDYLGNKIDPDPAADQDVITITRSCDKLANINTAISAILGFYDLVANSTNVNVWCYNDNILDSGVAPISGWTCDATHRMKIQTPWNTYTQCNKSHRHSGINDSIGFKVKSASYGINIDSPFVDFEGFIVESTGKAGDAISTTASASGNIVQCNVITDADNGIIQNGGSNNLTAAVNVIYDVNNGINIAKGFVYNNTVVDALSVGINGGPYTSVINNISNCPSGTAYTGTVSNTCISNDGTGSPGYTNVNMEFLNADGHDYHLSRGDWIAFNNGDDLTHDANYPFNFDIDMEYIYPSALNCWSIGADSIPNAETIKLYFSSSKNTNDLKTGISTKISIVSGLAEFSEDQENDNLGVGCIVDYDSDNKQCYLHQKVSENLWVVRKANGSIPKDISSVDVNSIKHAYGELNSAVSGITTDLANNAVNFTSLVAARYQINILVYKSSVQHSDNVNVDSIYLTDENNYIKIYTPIDVVNECNSKQRHTGWYYPGDFAIIKPSSYPLTSIEINAGYTIVEGLVVDGGSVGNDGIVLSGITSNSIVKSCIVFNCVDGIKNIHNGIRNVIVDNIVYDCENGIITSDADYVFSNTVVGCSDIGIDNNATSNLINNIVQGSSTVDYSDSSSIQYCLSSDSSAGTNNNCINETVLTFEDSSNKNYHLSKYDFIARTIGKQLVANSGYSFSDDASGAIRDSRWGLGALEFEPLKVFYSVGSTYIDNPGMFSIIKEIGQRPLDTRSIIIFNESQVDENMGVGNEVISTVVFYNGCLIKEKITDKKWVVTDYMGFPLDPVTDQEATVIKSVFYNLSNALSSLWSDPYIGVKNLAQLGLQVNIACYSQDEDTVPAEVSDLYTDCDCTLKIYTPYDTVKEVNKKQRHDGRFGDGYTMSPYLGAEYAIKISNSDNITIEGLCFSNYGIKLVKCASYSIIGNIIKNCLGDGFESDSVESNSIDYVINNIIYNCLGDGIAIGTFDQSYSLSQSNIFNNTIYNCLRGIYIKRNSVNGVTPIIINNICQKSNYVDFAVSWSDSFLSQNNVSSDDSLPTTYGSLNYLLSDINFIDSENDIFDLNSVHDFSAIDTALDISDISNYSFLTDAALRPRETGLWERGALELSEIDGSGMLFVVPLIMEGTVTSSNTPPTLVLHLRDNFLSSYDTNFQFSSIYDLNVFLANNTYYDSYNLEIDIEGGTKFEGMFELRNRNTRTVKIKTYSEELNLGPASFIYTDGVADINSLQSMITFENVKVYSSSGMTADYLLPSNPLLLSKLKFINSIVQLNKDAVADYDECIVHSYNTIFIYRNNDNSSTLYLSKNSKTGNFIVNSMVLSFFNGNLEFITCNTSSSDEVRNVLSYNYNSSYTFVLGNIGHIFNSLENTDPLIEEFSIDETDFDIAILMDNAFKPIKRSPVVDAGDNNYVMSETDIIGNDRIFDYNKVDIGVYELQVHNIKFTSKDISELFQGKLVLNYSGKNYSVLERDLILKDLYDQFNDNLNYRDEFARESKIIIMLKSNNYDYKVFTDKKNILVREFEAYYNASSRSIIVVKQQDFYGNLFNNVFGDGRCIFEFNEATHLLTAYINDTFYKGASGDRNPIKNVRFGGPSLLTN